MCATQEGTERPARNKVASHRMAGVILEFLRGEAIQLVEFEHRRKISLASAAREVAALPRAVQNFRRGTGRR